jgi:hypothetical protein
MKWGGREGCIKRERRRRQREEREAGGGEEGGGGELDRECVWERERGGRAGVRQGENWNTLCCDSQVYLCEECGLGLVQSYHGPYRTAQPDALPHR